MAVPAPENPGERSGRTQSNGAVSLDHVLTESAGSADLSAVNKEIAEFRSDPKNWLPITQQLLSKTFDPGDKAKDVLPKYDLSPAVDRDGNGFASSEEIRLYTERQRAQGAQDNGEAPPPPPVPVEPEIGPRAERPGTDGRIINTIAAAAPPPPDEPESALDRLNNRQTQFTMANLTTDANDPLGTKGISAADALGATDLYNALQGIKLLDANYSLLNSTEKSKLKHLDSLSVAEEIKPLLQKNLTTEAKAWLSAAQPYIDALGKDNITRADLNKLIETLSPKVQSIHGWQGDPNAGVRDGHGKSAPFPPSGPLFPDNQPMPSPGMPSEGPEDDVPPDDGSISPDRLEQTKKLQRLI